MPQKNDDIAAAGPRAKVEPNCEADCLRTATMVAHAEFHARLTSTNDRAAQAAQEGRPLPLVIVADEQTSGRGRGKNVWWTGQHNLAMSLAIDPSAQGLSRQLLPRLSLTAAVALIEATRPLLGEIHPGLHWPNDVYANGRKLAGILVECPAPQVAIIGIGLNLNTSFTAAPAEVRRRATSILELTGRRTDRLEFLAALLRELEDVFNELARSADEFGRSFDRLCLQCDETLTVNLGGKLITGRCQGIAPDGALLLATPDGPQRIYSGCLVTPDETPP
jgi:BirA family biotin operon repressor/biotin-[acetyl-CoA-carboxylase] ligase